MVLTPREQGGVQMDDMLSHVAWHVASVENPRVSLESCLFLYPPSVLIKSIEGSGCLLSLPLLQPRLWAEGQSSGHRADGLEEGTQFSAAGHGNVFIQLLVWTKWSGSSAP